MVYSINGEQFTRRKLLTINTASAALTDYQIPKTISYESIMQSNLEDMRFTTLPGINIPYWEESVTTDTDADIWMNVPSISNSVPTYLWQYYGNPSVSSASNGANTFIQFKGSTTTSDFKESNVNTSAQSNRIRINYTSVTPETNSYIGVTKTSFGTADEIYTTIHNGGSYIEVIRNNGSFTQDSTALANPTTNTYEFILQSGSVIFFRDDVEYDTITTTIPDEDMGLFANTLGSNVWNWGFISKYTPTEPTWAADGNEQHQRRTPSFMN